MSVQCVLTVCNLPGAAYRLTRPRRESTSSRRSCSDRRFLHRVRTRTTTTRHDTARHARWVYTFYTPRFTDNPPRSESSR